MIPRGFFFRTMTTINTSQPILSALQAARPDEAERLCHAALKQDSRNADVLFLLALAQQQQHRLEQAVETYARLAGMFPDSALHWGNYATALREVGRQDEAVVAYRAALRLAPDDTLQWINLGLLQLQQLDYMAARESLLRAVGLDPTSAIACINAARACSACRDYRAEALIQPWREWGQLNDSLLFELADLHLVQGDAGTAQILLEQLLQRTPAHHQARLLLAAVYERVNRLADADTLLDRITSQSTAADPPTMLEIAHQQAVLALRRSKPAEARDILARSGPRHQLDYAHYFVNADACDKLGDLPAALASLQTAHALQMDELKAVVPYRFEPDAPVLPAAVGKVSRAEYLDWPGYSAPDADHSPIFIVGFPRSGTTLLEQMLDAHPGMQSMDERPFFNILADQLSDFGAEIPRDLGKLSQRDCDELRKGYLQLVCSKIPRRWDARLVDKNPLNMLWLPMIHRLFPEAKFILALRHPCDVLVSNYMQNFRSSVLALACSSIERLASAYVTAMECWLHHVEVFQPNLLVSRYEDLVADPAAHSGRIAQFLGVADASPMLNFHQHARDKGYIATPSYSQVIQPVNRKGLNRWLRYRDALQPALPILKPMLDHWGYSTD